VLTFLFGKSKILFYIQVNKKTKTKVMDKKIVEKSIIDHFGYTVDSFSSRLAEEIIFGIVGKDETDPEYESIRVGLTFNPVFLRLIIAREINLLLSPSQKLVFDKNNNIVKTINEANTLEEAEKLFDILMPDEDKIEEMIQAQNDVEHKFWQAQFENCLSGKDVVSEAQEMTRFLSTLNID
jgi:hypothetical protein